MKTKSIVLATFLFSLIVGIQAQTTFSYAGRGGNPNPPTSSGIDGSHNASSNQKQSKKITESHSNFYVNKNMLNEHGEHPERRKRQDKIYHPPYTTGQPIQTNPQDGAIQIDKEDSHNGVKN
jgi:hypothetical protein